jgi:DNA repair protein RecN (Recombination protein N)
MLVSLYVKDFAIVSEVEIALGAGLTVVSGETGAGKSLLVDALLFLIGARADAGMVRFDCAGSVPLGDWVKFNRQEANATLERERQTISSGHQGHHNNR